MLYKGGLMEKHVKLTTSKERITTAIFVIVIIMILLYTSSLNLENSPTYTSLIGDCLLFIGLNIALKIETKGWVSVLWNGLLIVLAVALSYTSINLIMGGNICANEYKVEEKIISIFICLFVYLFFLFLTVRFSLTLIIGGIFWFIFGLIAYYVHLFRGDFFLFPDIFSAKTAMDVVGNYHFNLTFTIIVYILMFISIIISALNASWKSKNIKQNIFTRIISLSFCICMICVFWIQNLERFYDSWSILQNEYLYSFAVSAKMFYPLPPNNYSLDMLETYMDNDLYLADSNTDLLPVTDISSTVNPNIIAIMNESFSDLAVLGDFETNIDYMPFIHSLEENTIKGNTYVSVFGGGTCDSEYTFLTGNTTAFLPTSSHPYQQYIDSSKFTPSLVNTLHEQRYTSEIIHPNIPSSWNRSNVYTSFGADQFIDINKFVSPSYTRNYVSDISCYNQIITDYETNNLKNDLPQFYFNITIANHGGYNMSTDDLEAITITGHEGEFPQAEQYLSLIKESDRAFEELVNYFSYQKEPTIILFFGDHQARIEDEFYEFLKNGKPLEEWSVEELQQRYVTPFIIWANYDIPEMTIDKLSVNYLAPLLLKTAGLEMTPYDEYLLNLSKEIPVINTVGIIDKEDHYYKKGEATPYDDKLLEYQQLLYNNIIDTKHRQTNLYTLNE